jgi:hypothetical protein
VTTNAAVENQPAFSTDGRFLSFTSTRTGIAQVWRVPRPSGPSVQLTTGTDPAGASDWMPFTYAESTWVARSAGTSTKGKYVNAVAKLPDGSKLFETGTLVNNQGYAVGGFLIAYDSAGSQLWAKTFTGGSGYGASYALAVSPDASKVYVAGWVDDSAHVGEYSTTDGTLLHENNTTFGPGFDSVWGIIVSPDSSKVYVSATDYTASGAPRESVTYALNSSLGMLWHVAHTKGDPIQSQIRLSPSGDTLYWIGFQYGAQVTNFHQNNYLTVAYRTSDGNLNWSMTYNGPAGDEDDPWALALSPDGTKVFVTGYSVGGATTGVDQATVAYLASNGSQQWVSRFDSPNHGWDFGNAIAVSPDGSTVYTGGTRSRAVGSRVTDDYLGTSINAGSGSLNWSAFYNGPGDSTGATFDLVASVNVVPDGSQIYLSGWSYRTGMSFDFTTVGYDEDGNRIWLGRYDGTAHGVDYGQVSMLSPDGSTLYVAGRSRGTYLDAAMVAWDLSGCGPCRVKSARSEGHVPVGPATRAGSLARPMRSVMPKFQMRHLHPLWLSRRFPIAR